MVFYITQIYTNLSHLWSCRSYLILSIQLTFCINFSESKKIAASMILAWVIGFTFIFDSAAGINKVIDGVCFVYYVPDPLHAQVISLHLTINTTDIYTLTKVVMRTTENLEQAYFLNYTSVQGSKCTLKVHSWLTCCNMTWYCYWSVSDSDVHRNSSRFWCWSSRITSKCILSNLVSQ